MVSGRRLVKFSGTVPSGCSADRPVRHPYTKQRWSLPTASTQAKTRQSIKRDAFLSCPSSHAPSATAALNLNGGRYNSCLLYAISPICYKYLSEEKAKDFQKFCTAWLSFGKTSISRAINRRPDWGTGLAYNRPLPGKESPKGAKRPPREAPRAASSCLLIYWASYWYWR